MRASDTQQLIIPSVQTKAQFDRRFEIRITFDVSTEPKGSFRTRLKALQAIGRGSQTKSEGV
ncbi:hypothetical protein MCRY_07665 [Marivita cryptomonadis]|nr:hypothetical protein MCRY_07665 [Marivita cryptomonadis]